jgi:hypothetical protein
MGVEKFYNEELHDLYCSPTIVRVIKFMRWVGDVTRMGGGRGMYGVLVVKPEGTKPLGKPRCRWEDYIKTDLQEVECGVWTGLSWLRIDRWWAFVNALKYLWVP